MKIQLLAAVEDLGGFDGITGSNPERAHDRAQMHGAHVHAKQNENDRRQRGCARTTVSIRA